MRNSWLVGLAACAMATFSACSTDEGDVKTQNPVTEYTVPATAEIGGALEIKGKGFDSSAQIYLKSSAGVETIVNDLVTSVSEAKFNIPSTLTAGVYTVVLKQKGSWELGSIRLSVAQNPILNLVMPSAIKLGKALEIEGIGFSSASKIFLETADVAKTRTELTSAVNASGISCTIPNDVKAGNYNVILEHNNIDWVLAENVPAAVYKRMVGIKQIDQSTYDLTTAGAYYTANAANLALEGIDSKEMFFELLDGMLGGHEGQIVSKTEKSDKYIYAGDQLASIKQDDGSGEGEKEAWSFSYADNVLTGANKLLDPKYSGIESIAFTANNGKVESSTVVNYSPTTPNPDDPENPLPTPSRKTRVYTWNYDADGYCTTLTLSNGKAYKTFIYSEKNLTGIKTLTDESLDLKYTAQSKVNNIFAPDAALQLLNTERTEVFVRVASLLGLSGQTSVKLAATQVIEDPNTGESKDAPLTWTLDTDGYAISAERSETGVDPLFSQFPTAISTRYEFIYE